MKKKIMIIIGTRPEATKMATIILELRRRSDQFETFLLLTGQHKEQILQALDIFNIKADKDLDIMKPNQTLSYITSESIRLIGDTITVENPDLILVHGDTQAALCGSLAAYLHRTPVGHIEAGLRTFNKYSPYPEEMNRKISDSLSDYLFAPTETSKENLLREGYSEEYISVVGQTSIDAGLMTYKTFYNFKEDYLNNIDFVNKKIITVTVHRRENYGVPMENIFKSILKIANDNEDVIIIFPVHKSPIVRQQVYSLLSNHNRIKLIEPLEYSDMINLIGRSYMLMSDSGGLQEEACIFPIPMVLLRNSTERPEAVSENIVKLVGTEYENIIKEVQNIISSDIDYEEMKSSKNPYGDGTATKQIVEIIQNKLLKLELLTLK